MIFLARILLAAALAAAAAATAQPVRVDNAEAELVAAVDAIVPGQPLSVGLVIRHDPHWHTYWRVPGDSGLPTTINWQLPAGFTAGPIEWPVPKRLPIGPLMNFGYEGELLLPVQISVPAELAPGQTVTIKARGDWLICREVCIPGGADLQLALPVRAAAAPSRFAPLFDSTRAQIPRPATLQAASATIDGGRIRLAYKPAQPVRTLEFFPLDESRIEPAAAQTLRVEADGTALYLTAAQPLAAEFTRLRGVLVANGGPAARDSGGWAGEIDVPLAAGVVPVVAAAPAAAIGAGEAAAPTSFWIALVGAFVGGLILNLMPCVFPVMSLKLVGLMQHERADAEAGHPHASLRAHGLAFAAGVVLCFVLLAALLIGLRAAGAQLGWGFQLQTPWVIAALLLLFFVIGLNLIGAFEFVAGVALASGGPGRWMRSNPLGGSFATGLLAVIVASPCTAPFMGAALGYAITQPAPTALSVFAMLGVGMATPYLALTWMPALLQRLPRPGVWMLRFKQVMAFPMFATCVWLVWVLAQQVGVDALALVLVGLVLAAFAAWAYGLAQAGSSAWRWVALATVPLALYAVFAGTLPGSAPAPGERAAAAAGDWQPWSRATQEAQTAAGRPVFVDFTAAWCVTCQVNKRLVLSSDAVREAFARHGVTMLRADWTNRDDEITRELARFNRSGVPLYVLYDRRGAPRVLPELLTERTVLDALERL